MSATTRVVTTVTNASTKTYSYSGIDLLDDAVATLTDQIDVYLTPANTGIQVQLTAATEYTYATLPTKEITLIGARATNLAVGDIITIKRSTKDDERYTDFTDLGFLRSEDVNTNGDQLLFLIQEARTDVQDALVKTDDLTKWQGEGLPSTNCGNATSSTGWATLGQVVALISGGDPMDVGEGLYDEQSGDNSTTAFNLPDFPTTDISDAKIIVDISGVLQRPGIDYEYVLNGDSVPTVNFLLGAPPTGTNNVHFRVLPGVVTTTYAAATLDGDVIISNTLNGNAVIDATLDGDALIDSSVPLTKLEFADTAEANRFIVVNASEVPSLQQITFLNITTTGPSLRTDIGNDEIDVSAPGTNLSTTPTYTNSHDTTQIVLAHIRVQSTAGSITLTPDGGSAETVFAWASPGGAVQDIPITIPVPPAGVLTFTSTGGTLQRIVEVEA